MRHKVYCCTGRANKLGQVLPLLLTAAHWSTPSMPRRRRFSWSAPARDSKVGYQSVTWNMLKRGFDSHTLDNLCMDKQKKPTHHSFTCPRALLGSKGEYMKAGTLTPPSQLDFLPPLSSRRLYCSLCGNTKLKVT